MNGAIENRSSAKRLRKHWKTTAVVSAGQLTTSEKITQLPRPPGSMDHRKARQMTEALFASEGAPYANFPSPGTNYQGTVTRVGQVQARKFVPPNQRAAGKQGELEFWPDMRPKMVAIITLQTDLRDPSIPGDNGERSVWIKGKSMTDYVKGAVRNAGAQREGIVPGGWFSITFTHTTEPEFDGGSPTKHYQVEYRPPQGSDTAGIVGGQGNTYQQPAQAPQQAPVPQAAPPVQQAPAANPNIVMVNGSPIDVSTMTDAAAAAVRALAGQGAQQ